MAVKAGESSLFGDQEIKVIANGIDLELFFPGNRKDARSRIGLNPGKKTILFSAMNLSKNPYKGIEYLKKIVDQLHFLGWNKHLEMVIMGSSQPIAELDLYFPVHYLGQLRDELSLALVYNSADLYLAPSTMDNLPNTIIEALASGTPCVAFSVGGIPEQVDHKENGYLANPYDIKDFARGVDWILKDDHRWERLSKNARLKAKTHFDIRKQTEKYINLYVNLIGSLGK
jgi:glycosyltransferase involved in cell wall biosynthesis